MYLDQYYRILTKFTNRMRELEIYDDMVVAETLAEVSDIVRNLTYSDPVLDVKNISYFLTRIDSCIAEGRLGEYGACAFNLNRFSMINNRYGREIGDIIISNYIHGICDFLEDDEVVARIAGDDFAVFFHKEKEEELIEYFKGVGVQFVEGSEEAALISASAGFYMIPDDMDALDSNDILDHIVMAKNIARSQSGNSIVYCDTELVKKQQHVKRVQDLFPEAIQQQEFVPFYQPKYDVTHADQPKLVGAEVLCRWMYQGEMIMPGNFIEVLEQSNDICELDLYMLEHVCMDMRRWLDEGRKPVKVSVNLSRKHLTDLNVVRDLVWIIDNYEIPHELIEFELTETTNDASFADIKRVVKGLKYLGIGTMIDDYGVGYSSINLLAEVPWKYVKLDRKFLPAADDGKRVRNKKEIMIKNVINMARELGICCVAEGVENEEQLTLLKELHCQMIQGFLFGKPVPVEEFEKLF